MHVQCAVNDLKACQVVSICPPQIRINISLRLLALILCSNCSNTFNKVLTTIGGHMLNYFLQLGGSLELAQHPSRMVEAFHSRHDSCIPPNTQPITYTIYKSMSNKGIGWMVVVWCVCLWGGGGMRRKRHQTRSKIINRLSAEH